MKRGQLKAVPTSVLGSCLGWVASGLPVIMAGDDVQAGRFVDGCC